MSEKEKIIEALETIKELCKESERCSLCPFSNERALCMIKEENPETWTIRERRKVMFLE